MDTDDIPSLKSKVHVINVCRAGGPDIARCSINIHDSIDEIAAKRGKPMGLPEMILEYGFQAETIADALYDHLPQAVQERVIIRLMQRRVSGSKLRSP